MEPVAVEIGVPSEAAARRLSEGIVEERLAAGTKMTSSTVPGHYRWEGDVHERAYWTVTALTARSQVDEIYAYVDDRHEDELLPITFHSVEASSDYRDWIEANVSAA